MDPIKYSEKDKIIFEKLGKQGPLGKRALYIFQHLFLRKDFRDLVSEIRKKLDLPENGLDISKNEDHRKIFEEKYLNLGGFNGETIFNTSISLGLDISNTIDKYLEQSGITRSVPNMDWADGFIKQIVKEYVVLNNFLLLFKGNFGMASIETYGTTGFEAEDDERDPIELRLSIPISAKQEEVKEYIEYIWKYIEQARSNYLAKRDKVRFRPRNNFIRDLNILNKYLEIEKLSVSQRKEKSIEYIEIAVKKDLEKEGFTDIPDEGTIRSIVSRLKNEIKDKSSFWQEIEEYELPKKSSISNLDDF